MHLNAKTESRKYSGCLTGSQSKPFKKGVMRSNFPSTLIILQAIFCTAWSLSMHQVSYSSPVSTFCRNEIKDRNYKSVQQHIFISFSFSGKKMVAPHPPPHARYNFRWKFSIASPTS